MLEHWQLIWCIGFVLTLAFCIYRLYVNTKRGLIMDPYSVSGFCTLVFWSAIWPIFWVLTILHIVVGK